MRDGRPATLRAPPRVDDLRRLRPHLPQRRPAGRDRRRPRARARQQRPDPRPATAAWCPTTSTSSCSDTDLERLAPYDSTLARELSDQLQKHADAQAYVFPGPISIDFEPADDLTTGRFRIRSQAQAKVTGTATHTQVRRALALLEVNGSQHPLQPPGLVIGRGTEADIRINDPGISRRHAEFQITLGHGEQDPLIEVHDLGSTNGIRVDGRKVPRATLRDGSVVKVGTTTMTVRIVHEEVPGV